MTSFYYLRLRPWWNRLKRLVLPVKKHTFLFLLSPPHSGSTLLNAMLCTSKKVSVNNPLGTREGMWLTAEPHLHNWTYRWDENTTFDWPAIRNVWMRYWDLTRPVLLEKTPFTLFRSKQMEQTFPPAYFVVLIRNPYAIAQSLLRRKKAHLKNETEVAEFVVRCFRYQIQNVASLKHTLVITYEDLSAFPSSTLDRIVAFVPEIESLHHETYHRKFSTRQSHVDVKEVKNKNASNIGKLSPAQLGALRDVFYTHRATLAYFGYSWQEPPVTL